MRANCRPEGFLRRARVVVQHLEEEVAPDQFRQP
jgi:hypothetical protein